MHGRLRGPGRGESEVPIALPAGNIQETAEHVAGPRAEKRILRKQSDVKLTKRRDTREGSSRSDSEPQPLDFR